MSIGPLWEARLRRSSGLVLASLVMLCVLVAHAGTASSLARTWSETAAYSHGWLLLPVAVVLWWRRASPIASVARPSSVGFIALIALSIGALLSDLAALSVGSAVLLPALLVTAVYCACGAPLARSLLFPVTLLYCAVPLWSMFQPLLQQIAAVSGAAAARSVGTLLVRDGMSIEIASGTFEVMQGCSGLNFLLVAASIALLLGEALALGGAARVLVLASGAVIALTANALRIATLIVLGDRTGMRHYLVADDHMLFGWVLFTVFLAGWIWSVTRFAKGARFEMPPESAPADRTSPVVGWRRGGLAAAAVAVAGLGPALVVALERAAVPQHAAVAAAELQAVAGWAGPLSEPQPWRPQFSGAAAEYHGVYRSESTAIVAYRNVYVEQQPGRELVGAQSSILPRVGWSRRAPRADDGVASLPNSVRAAIATSAERGTWLVVSWYEVGGDVLAGDLAAKLTYAVHRVLRMPDHASAVMLAAQCDRDCSSAAAAVADFLASSGWVAAGSGCRHLAAPRVLARPPVGPHA